MKVILLPLFKSTWILFFSCIYTVIKIKALIHVGIYVLGGIVWQFKPFEPPFKFSFKFMYENTGDVCEPEWEEHNTKDYFLMWKSL